MTEEGPLNFCTYKARVPTLAHNHTAIIHSFIELVPTEIHQYDSESAARQKFGKWWCVRVLLNENGTEVNGSAGMGGSFSNPALDRVRNVGRRSATSRP